MNYVPENILLKITHYNPDILKDMKKLPLHIILIMKTLVIIKEILLQMYRYFNRYFKNLFTDKITNLKQYRKSKIGFNYLLTLIHLGR